jgi:hypothetical protein
LNTYSEKERTNMKTSCSNVDKKFDNDLTIAAVKKRKRKKSFQARTFGHEKRSADVHLDKRKRKKTRIASRKKFFI